jgi:hypothetical protein
VDDADAADVHVYGVLLALPFFFLSSSAIWNLPNLILLPLNFDTER